MGTHESLSTWAQNIETKNGPMSNDEVLCRLEPLSRLMLSQVVRQISFTNKAHNDGDYGKAIKCVKSVSSIQVSKFVTVCQNALATYENDYGTKGEKAHLSAAVALALLLLHSKVRHAVISGRHSYQTVPVYLMNVPVRLMNKVLNSVYGVVNPDWMHFQGAPKAAMKQLLSHLDALHAHAKSVKWEDLALLRMLLGNLRSLLNSNAIFQTDKGRVSELVSGMIARCTTVLMQP